jgi:hypothetical protein
MNGLGIPLQEVRKQAAKILFQNLELRNKPEGWGEAAWEVVDCGERSGGFLEE